MSLILQTTLSPKVDVAECDRLINQFSNHVKTLQSFNRSGMFNEQIQVMAEIVGSLVMQRNELKRRVGREERCHQSAKGSYFPRNASVPA